MNTKTSNPIERLYEGNDARDGACLAPVEKYRTFPARFDHGKRTLVAELPKLPANGDGHPVRLYETRYPARTFEVEVLSAQNSIGDCKRGWLLSTGSGDEMGALAARIALAAAEGMIALKRETQPS